MSGSPLQLGLKLGLCHCLESARGPLDAIEERHRQSSSLLRGELKGFPE